MTWNEQFDESLSTWLEESAPARIPDRVLNATFERTRGSRQHVNWRALLGRRQMIGLATALGSAAVFMVVAVLALSLYANAPGVGGPRTPDPRTPFVGTWISTSDADGGAQTMTVERAGNNTVDIVVTDTIATVCDLTPSTMTGTGTIQGKDLVIPRPGYRCDDGSEPRAVSGPPLEEQLRNLTFVRDAQAETLIDNFSGVWLREGAEAPSPTPSQSATASPSTSPRTTTRPSEAQVTELLNGFRVP
jgi:hypothetical protein